MTAWRVAFVFVDLSDGVTRGGNINLKGFRVRQWLIINSYHRSYLHDTHFGSIGPRVRSWLDQTNRHSFAFPFFFFSFFFYLRSTDKKSSRPIGKRLEKNCAFFVHCHLQTYPLPLFALQRYTIEKLCSSFYVITYMIHTWYVLQLSIYNDRRNVKNCSSMRSKIENFSKKFYSFHECGNILFFSAKSKVFVRNAKRIFYSNIQCSFFFIWFSLSA